MNDILSGFQLMWIVVVAIVCLTLLGSHLMTVTNERNQRRHEYMMATLPRHNKPADMLNVDGVSRVETRTHRPVVIDPSSGKTRPIRDWPQA